MHTGVSAPEALVLIRAKNDLVCFYKIGWRRGGGGGGGVSGVCHPLRIQFPAANQRRDETNFRAKTMGPI